MVNNIFSHPTFHGQMKKLITLMFLGCFAATTMFGQLTISTSFPNPAPGATATVDFTVTGFTDIVSSQFTLNYDPAVLQYSSISYTNPAFNGLNAAAFGAPPNTSPGTITFSWFDNSLSGVTVADGTLMFSIDFVAIGSNGSSSAITFGNSPTPIEFSDNNFQTLPPGDFTLIDGNVPVGTGGNNNGPLSTAFNCPSGATGDNICVDVAVSDFDLIQGFQYTISYDPSVLQFTGASGFNLVDLSTGNFGDVSPGVLTVSWNDVSSGSGVTVADGTVIFQICFNVVGAGGTSSSISVTSSPTAAEAYNAGSPGTNIGLNGTPCTFTTSGTGGSALSVQAGSVTGQPGSLVCVPYTVTNFNDIVSMQYVMNYDNTVLSFNSISNINPSINGLSSSSFNSATPGTINFSWFDNTIMGVTVPDGTVIYEVCYDIIGSLGQSSTLSYSGLIEASQNQNGSTNTVPLTTLPGNVSVVGAPGANFTIDADEVNSDGATNVCVPVTVLNFSQIVSMQFDITYDATHLDFTGPGNLTLTGLQTNNFNETNDGNIRLSWVTPNIAAGETLPNGTAIFELCFDKLGTTGSSSVISYNMNAVNEISDVNGEVTLKDFLDGSVTCTTGAQPLDVTSIAPVVTQIDCNGNTNGAIDVSTQGGVAPITYSWDDPAGSTTEDLTNLGPGTYTLTAMDANGATASTNAITINAAPSAITATNMVTDETAAGANDGAIDLTPSGGTPGYTFLWDDPAGSTTEDISGLVPGDYNVTITDANMCTMTVGPFTVAAFMAPLTITDNASSVVDVVCFGEATGSITVAVSGGTEPYTYAWSNGQNGTTANPILNLGAGTYNVTITDSSTPQQSASSSFVINEIATAALDCSVAIITDAMGGNNGAVDLVPSGGTAPYTFMWSNNQTTEDISSLAAGLYNVTVTDDNGCQQFCSHTVNQATDPLEIDETQSTVTDAACAGINSGSINVVVTGGCTPYIYAWSNGMSTQNIAALNAGDYILTVTDDCGDTDQATFTVGEPTTAVSVAIVSFNDESAPGANDGSITASAAGGTSPHTYVWSNGATTPVISGLTGGTYCVTVTDATGVCNADICQTVNTVVPNPMVLDFTISDPACDGGTGGIGVTVTGGTPMYTYTWSDGLFPGPNVSAPAGTYSVTVEDANGVQAFGNATLTAPSAIVLNGIAMSSGGNDGSIDLTITGGNPAYSTSWTGPNNFTATTEDISNLAPGQYCVETMDANGCTANACYNVGTTSNPPILTGGPNNNGLVGTNLTCNGDNTGAIDLTVSGGVGDLEYLWSPSGLTTQDISGLAAGTYTVVVTDQNNDSATATITLSEPSAINTTGMLTPEMAGSDGAIDIDVTGGSGIGYTYSWTGLGGFTASTQDISGLVAGQYIVNIQDSNGCTAVGIYTVMQSSNAAPTVAIANMIPADCNNENGALTVTVTPGNPPYTYAWSNGAPSSPTITGLMSGLYNVTVTDALGLQDILTGLEVTADMNSTSIPSTGVTIECESGDLNDGQVNITPVGGCLPYTFLWSNGATTEDITGLEAFDYRVTITDDCGCIFVSEDYTVCFNGGNLDVTDVTTDPLCNGGDDGSIFLTINTPGDYSFIWSDGSTGSSLTDLIAGSYTVTITDDNNNNAEVYTETFVLEEPDAIVITVDDVQHQGCPPGPGAVFISVEGGTFPYEYSWSSGATTQDLNPASVGFHQPTVIDANGCFLVGPDVEVTDDPPCAVEEVVENINCSNDCNGSIDINVVGGTAPYTFLWSNGATSEDIFGLCEGGYSLTITDNAGFTNTHNYSVIALSDGPVISGTVTPSSGNDGAIDVSVTQGTAPYTYSWTGPDGFSSSMEDISGLIPGDYFLTVTDAVGCTATAEFNVGSTLISADVTSEDCFGNMNGAIDITPAGSLIPPLTFQWTGPSIMETTEDLTGLEPGVYTVVITDGNGTTATSSWTINAGSNISATFDVNEPTAVGASDASATVNPVGGNGAYTYIWSNGQTTQTLTNVAAGTYTVTITDGNNCTQEETITINDFENEPIILVNINIDATSCTSACEAVATADISQSINTTPPYTFLWSDGQTTQTATGLCDSITYTVTATDANGVVGMGIVSNFPEVLTGVYTYADLGDGTFNIALDMAGGVEPYTYIWGNPIDSDGPNGVAPSTGTYSAIVMDANGCTFPFPDIFIPNEDECLDYRQVITPNDDGFNDNFEMSCLSQYPNNELEIYSRWGELKWITTDYNNTWEGTDMNGNLLPQGGYFFVFRYDDFNTSERRQIKGAITLLR